MSIHVSTKVWANGPADRRLKFLLLAIADHANDRGYAFPGLYLLAEKTACCQRTVIRNLALLESQEWVTVHHKTAGPSQKGNSYNLNMAKLSNEKNEATVDLYAPSDEDQSNARPQRASSPDKVAKVQVTNAKVQVTKSPSSGDKIKASLLKNRHEPSQQPSRGAELPFSPVRGLQSCGEAGQLAAEMLDRLAVVASTKTHQYAAESIRLAAQAYSMILSEATELIEANAKACLVRGETVNRFWFEDGKWKMKKTTEAAIGIYRPPVPGPSSTILGAKPTAHECSRNQQADGIQVWAAMRNELLKNVGKQRFDTWIRPIRATGLINGELHLLLPSSHFEGVEERLKFESYLPNSISTIYCYIDEPQAA